MPHTHSKHTCSSSIRWSFSFWAPQALPPIILKHNSLYKTRTMLSNHPPTESIPSYLSHPVPPAAAFVKGPHNISRKGMLKGKLSIMDWTCKNSMSFFLFELIMFWSSLSRIIHAQQEWEAALQWFEKATSDDSLAKEVDEVHLILWTTPWSADPQILHSYITFLEMAMFLSNNWLSSSQINMVL